MYDQINVKPEDLNYYFLNMCIVCRFFTMECSSSVFNKKENQKVCISDLDPILNILKYYWQGCTYDPTPR